MTEQDLILAAEQCRRRAVFHNRRGTSAQAEAYAEAGRRFQAEILEREEAMERDYQWEQIMSELHPDSEAG